MRFVIHHFNLRSRLLNRHSFGDCSYNQRMSTRLRNACALVIALLVLAVSSQGVVCESACSRAAQRSCCQAASGLDEMDMSVGRCSGDMSSAPGAIASDLSGAPCHHAAIVATETNASSLVGFNGVRWAARATLPSARLRGGNRSIAKGPPFRRTASGLLSVSLRV